MSKVTTSLSFIVLGLQMLLPLLKITGTGELRELKDFGSVVDETPVAVRSGSYRNVIAAPRAVWPAAAMLKEDVVDAFGLLSVILVPLRPNGRVEVVLRAKLEQPLEGSTGGDKIIRVV